MFDLDHWKEILNALAGNKLRTFLTAFGVFWGIFFLMIMMGSGNGLRNGITQNFEGSATNAFFVWSRSTTLPYRGLPPGRRFNLDNSDTETIRQQVPEAAIIAPRNQLGGFRSGNEVVRGKHAGAFNVMGDHPEIKFFEAIDLVDGRFINRIDILDKRKVAVIGNRVRTVLFEREEEPVGEHIRINGVYFKVVGVFASGSPGDERDRDEQTIYIPFSTFQRAFNFGDQVSWFAVASSSEVPASVAEQKVLSLLKRRHQINPDDDRALGHFNLEEEYEQVQGLFGGIRVLIWIVGIGTLAAGVIGVSNIMLVIVRERTHEIGVRRAIGATPLNIIVQILMEATLLTGVAGYLGLIAGMALTDFVSYTLANEGASTEMFMNPGVEIATAMKALAILVVSGLLAGVIPARRAVALSPVQALRTG